MIKVEALGETSIAVTVFREGGLFGGTPEELQDGNTLPSLCMAAGEGACKQVCQLANIQEDNFNSVLCAEENVEHAAQNFGIGLDRLVIAAANGDNIVFADSSNNDGEIPDAGKYQIVLATNAYFLRPLVDTTLNGQPVRAVAMRLADCASVAFHFLDREGEEVIGQAHFSRTNMRPEGSFLEEHELNGDKVSWAEYVVGNALEHYAADPKDMQISLVASIEADDFILDFSDDEKLERTWPGWLEAGFAEKVGDTEEGFAVKVRYREMVAMQIDRAAKRFGIPVENISFEEAINTGKVESGHASNHWSGKRKGLIAPGRDMCIVGLTEQQAQARIVQDETK
jgi:hypothetical protein